METPLREIFSALSSLLTEWPTVEETLESDLAKLENHLRQLEACRLAPEEDAPILQQFPGLRQALCAKINAKISTISASISESTAAQSRLLEGALEKCDRIKEVESSLEGILSDPASPGQPRLSQRLEWAVEAENLLRRQELKLLHFDQVRGSELGEGEDLRRAFETCKMSRQTRDRLSFIVNLAAVDTKKPERQ